MDGRKPAKKRALFKKVVTQFPRTKAHRPYILGYAVGCYTVFGVSDLDEAEAAIGADGVVVRSAHFQPDLPKAAFLRVGDGRRHKLAAPALTAIFLENADAKESHVVGAVGSSHDVAPANRPALAVDQKELGKAAVAAALDKLPHIGQRIAARNGEKLALPRDRVKGFGVGRRVRERGFRNFQFIHCFQSFGWHPVSRPVPPAS